jgi:uroporphyrinogen-III decarboxylase
MDQIPAAFILNPNWWFHNYGISFGLPFYLDKDLRIQNDVAMRRAMYQRFGLGEPDPQPRPIIGSMHVAGGFVLPALFGAEIRFAKDEAPWPVPLNLSADDILALRVPDIETTWPMDRLIADMDRLEDEFGYVVGDFDTDGILNTALVLRGQQLFIDLLDSPKLVHHLFSILAETHVRVASNMRSRTGTCAVATNRSILNVDPALYLHSNCSVQMISPAVYQEFLLPYELYLAERLQPYGIHHCGDNLHLFTDAYAQVPSDFYDVGWGSDVAHCRAALPEAFLNLRLSPVRMLQATPDQIRQDVEQLLASGGSGENVGICCINMDYGTPDANVLAVLDAVADFSRLSQERELCN